ncbi:Hypp8465 [Branchiostoma lanceolatum]|uniref:Hypp8465 protein n=1 Tax=Branchiostoma lanceolatum TaxID=7740 RepID=A0A8J9Z8Q0_BRALA|nr:Hypp8465 [Branchiostoma lanceolatum]
MIEEWTEAMDSGEIVECVFLDLRKAFDKVWHAGLLSKLRAYGISGSMHNWFSSPRDANEWSSREWHQTGSLP